jgi:hypothetical protein
MGFNLGFKGLNIAVQQHYKAGAVQMVQENEKK